MKKLCVTLFIILLALSLFGCFGGDNSNNKDNDIDNKETKYTITFNTNGGSPTYPAILEAGQVLNEPVEPTKDDFIFDGWYEDFALTAEHVFGSRPTRDMVLYAKWKPNQSTITFFSNGGSSLLPITQKIGTTITSSCTPTKIGYTFDGWYLDDKTFEKKYIISIMPSENLSLYAKWKINEYTITFISDGIEVDQITDDYGKTLSLPLAEKIGHNFEGWYLDNGAYNYKFSQATMPGNSFTLYAKWSKKECTITFYSNGGNEIEKITKLYREKISAPPLPDRVGYVFDGWYTDNQTFRNKYVFNTMPEGSFSLYAKWQKLYTIMFNTNEGSIVNPITKKAGENTAPPTAPYKATYYFIGWYMDNETFEEEFIFDKMPEEDITVYAKWGKYHTITFDSNSGSLVQTKFVKDIESISEPKSPYRAMYVFDGWYTDNQTFNNKYVFNTQPEGDLTLYAKWNGIDTPYQRINSDNIPNIEGSYLWFGEYPQTVKAEKVAVSEQTDSRGYYLGSDGYYYAKVVSSPYGDYKFSTKNFIENNKEYYFRVEPIKWRIVDDYFGEALLVCENIITTKMFDNSSNNYAESSIRGWLNEEFYNTAFNVLQKDFILSSRVDNSPQSAGYTANQYTYTNTNDKVFLPSYYEVNNEAYGFYIGGNRERLTTDYSRVMGVQMSLDNNNYGKGFWWLRSPYLIDTEKVRAINSLGNFYDVKVNSDILGIVPSIRFLLYKVDSTTITFDSNRGSLVDSITKKVGETITEPPHPTREMHNFDGWYIDNHTFTTRYDFDKMESRDITLYAKWREIYILSFYIENNEILETIQKESGEVVTAPNEPKKSNHTFGGWYTDNVTFKNKYIFDTMPPSSLNLYAKWLPYQRIDVSGTLQIDGDYILFGEYPQTIMADNVTITGVQNSGGYYLGSDGYYYAKVISAPYSNYKFSNNVLIANGKEYYFKVEPIKWRILREDNGSALILCENILTNQAFDTEMNNNYEESSIRAWLNNEFYLTAFNILQQKFILLTEVDNSAPSTGYSTNQYASPNTNDKIFLPSYIEVYDTDYGLRNDYFRQKEASDYSRASGVKMSTEKNSYENYYGNGYWWLRSPKNNNSFEVRHINGKGDIAYNTSNYHCYGILPSLRISLT